MLLQPSTETAARATAPWCLRHRTCKVGAFMLADGLCWSPIGRWSLLRRGGKAIGSWVNLHGEAKRLHKFYRCEDDTIARDRRMIGQKGPVALRVRI